MTKKYLYYYDTKFSLPFYNYHKANKEIVRGEFEKDPVFTNLDMSIKHIIVDDFTFRTIIKVNRELDLSEQKEISAYLNSIDDVQDYIFLLDLHNHNVHYIQDGKIQNTIDKDKPYELILNQIVSQTFKSSLL